MTSVFYHLNTNTWTHNHPSQNTTIGHNRLQIKQDLLAKEGGETLEFNVHSNKINNNHLGPIVGILTNEDRAPFSGNKKTFKRICKNVLTNGGIPVVFTPTSFSQFSIKCYTFCFLKKKWIELFSPLPDVIYNRIPSVQFERKEEYKTLRNTIQKLNIPYFNESYLSKIQTFSILSKDPFLKKFLPEMIKIDNENDLKKYLKKMKCIYVKKHNSSQGLGIFKLTLLNKQQVLIRNSFHVEVIKSVEDSWKFLNSLTESYLCQQCIISELPDGRKFDLRILVHKKMQSFIISGIGVRVGSVKGITTHVPRGGTIISLNDLPIDVDYELLKTIVQKTGEALNKNVGNFFEFSIDIGIQNNHFYIYEVNSKPMVFDEPEIKEKGLENLIQLYYELSNF